MSARDRLIDELRRHALVLGDVVLTSGQTARYYVDAKRAILDRLAGGAERIRAACPAPYAPLATIDDVYPDRPDRG